jgi:nucleotide-binding universal stress UspA family protein
MNTIVCATDLSPGSEAVVTAAATMSRALGWPLELVHLVHVPLEMPDLLSDELITDMTAASEEKLHAQVAPLREAGLHVAGATVVGLGHDVHRYAQAQGAGLLVLGTHARTGPSRFFLGSVAERTIQAASCPVLVVPPHATGRLVDGTAGTKPLRVLAGIDFSPASDAALAWLRAFGRRTDFDGRLLHLYSPAREHERLGLPPPQAFDIDQEVVAVLSRELRAHVEAHLGTDLALRIRPNWGGEDDPIAWEAETDGADLLIIGTSQTRHSTALATVRGAHLPVLCVPGQTAATEAPVAAPVRSVLVATDFSPSGNAAITDARRLLLPAGGDLVLAHVTKPGPFGLDPDRQNELETCLLGLLPDDQPAGPVHARAFVTADASPGEAIVKAVRRFAPDVVVIAAQGRSTERRGARGRTTDYIVGNSPRPVMVVPPPAARQR